MANEEKETGPVAAPTGIKGFDKLVEGGIPRGSVVTVTGPTGSGKTLFALQFLYNGIEEYDEPALYISFDERKRALSRNMTRYGWNLAKLEADKKLIFIEYPVHEASAFLSAENTLFNMIVELGIERVVIDPITPLTLQYETEEKKRQGMLALVNTLRSWGCTTLLVSESEGEESSVIESISDGIIKLYNFRKANYRMRALEVVKMRGVAHIEKLCPVRFTQSGMEVYPHQYLFE